LNKKSINVEKKDKTIVPIGRVHIGESKEACGGGLSYAFYGVHVLF